MEKYCACACQACNHTVGVSNFVNAFLPPTAASRHSSHSARFALVVLIRYLAFSPTGTNMKFCPPRRFSFYFVIAIAIFFANQSGKAHAQPEKNTSIHGNFEA
jgi:hypothetical protein